MRYMYTASKVYDSDRLNSTPPILQTRMGYFHHTRAINSEKYDLFKSHQSQPMGIRDFHSRIG